MFDKSEHDISSLFKQVLPEDLVKFGLIPELIGRLPITVSLDLLDVEALLRILKEPRNALTRQYQALFDMDGQQLIFTDDALQAVAEKAIARGTGARGLRSIMEETLKDVMYELPSDDEAATITITKEMVDGEGSPRITKRGAVNE